MNKYSAERKELQKKELIPSWYTTQGWQMFKNKYLWATTAREQYSAIAYTAAKHLNNTSFGNKAYGKFFEILWKGWLSPSTPVLANMGTTRGFPISCFGNYISDSIDGFYSARRETALITKHGGGTSGYLGDIRSRGSAISIGGVASGSLPVFKGFVRDMQEVAQGVQRRGAWAGYLPIDHGDFDELADYLHHHPDDLNLGWNVSDAFIHRLNSGDSEAVRRYQKALKIKMITGKGYFFFVDKANRARPEMYKERKLGIKASNLCTEIMLHSDEAHSFTCVLGSMNVAKYDEWKDTDAVYWSTIFLDCVVSEFLEKARGKAGMERAVAFTEKGRALGLGQCGLHTYLQKKKLPFESLEAKWASNAVAQNIQRESLAASTDMASELGEPEWCKSYGVRNTHRTAVAPTKSTALIMGGISEGINPDPAVVFSQNTSAGEVERITPVFLALMKEKDVYDKKHISELENAFGSCQHVDWLTAEEKAVFKTAFEMDMTAIVRMAAGRQPYVCQGQSVNLFFGSDATEEYISRVHKEAFLEEDVLSLYYCYSRADVAGSKGECSVCM